MRQAGTSLERASELRDGDQLLQAVAPALAAARGFLLCGRTIRSARALRVAGLALVLADRPADAAQRLRAARQSLADAGAGSVTLAGIDVTLAEALRSLGHVATAQERLQSARAAYAAAGHDELLPTIDHDLAIFTAELGDAEDAVEGLVAARQAFLDQRDREGVAACSHNIGLLLHDLGHLDDAVEYFQEARSIFLAVGRDAEAAACDQNVGVVLHDMGRPEEAARRLLDARNRYARNGALRSAGECEHNLSVVLTVLGRADEAAACLAKAEAAGVRAPADTGAHPVIPLGAEAVEPQPERTDADSPDDHYRGAASA
ncbi:MAG: tetratricopeptide repeat protein [Acidimicrobiales bacterium]